MQNQFNIEQFFLTTQCIYVYCVDLRTLSDYFPIQHELVGLYERDLTLYRTVVNIFINSLTFKNFTPCPHCICVFNLSQNKQRLVPITA